jgi:glucose-6-phosphate 1-dehydrogenase
MPGVKARSEQGRGYWKRRQDCTFAFNQALRRRGGHRSDRMSALAKIPPGVGPKFPQVVVLVGATGDLSQRKLLPGLFHLCSAGFIPTCRIIGVSLDDIDVEAFRAIARGALDKFSPRSTSDADWATFSATLDYVPMAAGACALKAAVEKAERSFGGESRRLHYLSVPPAAALSAVRLLAEAGLVERSRVIMEKPFGTDLASAKLLNARLHEVFAEDQIFRIDHFLGKEPAQNILAFRFANGLFEPIWNRNFIDHVQIDVPETLGLGKRSAFYEATGAYRDMVVTHLFQILAFMAMEPPTALLPAPISEEKNKVFRSMLPIEPKDVVRGQYAGYRAEEGVDPESDTETFIALKCTIDNWRWAGVPFFLRTGKRMAEGQRIISIAFREAPKSMFPVGSGVGAQGPDHLTFDLADASKVSLSFYGKRPGPGMRLDKLSMQFALNETGLIGDVLEAYERLILDAMRGEATLFTRNDEVEAQWRICDPIVSAWSQSKAPLPQYEAGSQGPVEADALLREGDQWRAI